MKKKGLDLLMYYGGVFFNLQNGGKGEKINIQFVFLFQYIHLQP